MHSKNLEVVGGVMLLVGLAVTVVLKDSGWIWVGIAIMLIAVLVGVWRAVEMGRSKPR